VKKSDNKITSLNWPEDSPDLKPIENLGEFAGTG
jgi:hypothetical protein